MLEQKVPTADQRDKIDSQVDEDQKNCFTFDDQTLLIFERRYKKSAMNLIQMKALNKFQLRSNMLERRLMKLAKLTDRIDQPSFSRDDDRSENASPASSGQQSIEEEKMRKSSTLTAILEEKSRKTEGSVKNISAEFTAIDFSKVENTV